MFSGEMVALHVNLNTCNKSEAEIVIISGLKKFLSRRTDKETADRLDQLLDDLHVVAVRQVKSLLLYCYCESMSEMFKLTQLLESGRLKEILEEVFGILTGNSTGLNVSVRLHDKEQLIDCYNQLLREGELKDGHLYSFVWCVGQSRC